MSYDIRKLPGKISITRTSSTRSDDAIRITIEDAVSGIQTFEGVMTLDAFAKAVTGFACQPISGEFSVTDDIGKTYVHEPRKTWVSKAMYADKAPGESYSEHSAIKAYLNGLHEGTEWTAITYLGSQRSIVPDRESDGYFVNYRVFKYVDTEENKE